jgi:DNA-binding HxlR family transcriptional regulator
MAANRDRSTAKLVKQTRECDERLTRAFGLLGKRWSGIILGLLLQGPARFAVLAQTIPGISERVLSQRLTELSAAGLIHRKVLGGRPVGVVYELSESGRAMGPGLQQLAEWAERYFRQSGLGRGKRTAKR